MLVRDGLEYAFSHRSFQEYFAAYFLARVKVDEFENAMPHLLERIGDNVLTMFAEMSREKFEEAWALPAIQKVCKAMEGIAPLDNPIGYCKKVLGTPVLGFFTDGRAFFGLSETAEVFKERAALVAVYDLNRRVYALTKKDDSPDPVRREFREKIQAKTLLANDPRFEPLRATTVTPPRGRLSHEEPEAGKTKEPVTITLTEADNGWFNDYVVLGPVFPAEAKVLRELKAEIDYRVQERRRGLAKIFAS